jgi:hypothetical protein
VADAQRTVPFDYTFRFDLKGERDRVHRGIVTVSVEAMFTAVSLGYGVIPTVTPVEFGALPRAAVIFFGAPAATGAGNLGNLVFGDLVNGLAQKIAPTTTATNGLPALEAALRSGIRLNPQFADLALQGGNLTPDVFDRLFQVVSAPSDEVQFLYALFDEGSGREFQSEPLLNTAGLGASNGKRPFRNFARPITFAPRTTIRMEITEKSDFQGELHVSLHGYKVLGSPDTPTGRQAIEARRWRRR